MKKKSYTKIAILQTVVFVKNKSEKKIYFNLTRKNLHFYFFDLMKILRNSN